MKLFPISSACIGLCLAAVMTGCDSQTSNQWAVNSVQVKNKELAIRLSEMKATIRRAEKLQTTEEQLAQKRSEASEQYRTLNDRLVTAIERNMQVSREYGNLTQREDELNDRLKRLGEAFKEMQEELEN